jgi:uncharacterized membrane protein
LKEVRAIPSKDRQTYDWAARTLRLGMYTSFGAMVIGLVWWLVESGGGPEASQNKVIPLDRILPELFALNPLALLNLGVVLLLITPGVTLLTQIATFAAARNWRFAGIATLVAAILLLSLAISLKWIVLF